MKRNPIRQIVFPILAATIWGTAFVFQSVSADRIGPFSFNAIRGVIAAAMLAIVCLIAGRLRARGILPQKPRDCKQLLLGGICCGVALAVAANLQQMGLSDVSAGKCGFITAMYIVIVPVLGLFLRRRVTPLVWCSVALAVAGLYFLCIDGAFSIGKGDLYVLLCALVFSIHILLIDHFTQTVDGIELSCVQFVVLTVLSGIAALLTETVSWADIKSCMGAFLYVGILSGGVAYTLQILAQKGSNPTVVSLLLSLESVIATISGAIILGDRMSGREYLGCALMMVAVVLAQLPMPQRRAAAPCKEA